MLKRALSLCVVVASLFIFQTPALAIGIFSDSVSLSLASDGIPSGTSITFSPGSTSTSGSSVGNAVVSTFASSTPGLASASVFGSAGPSSGFSSAFASVFADGSATLFNSNPTSVTFPLTLSNTQGLSTSNGPSDSAFASGSYQVSLDNIITLASGFNACGFAVSCSSFGSGSQTLFLGLSPGSHSLQFSVNASGFAESLAATPEPATLLLLGTTMVGLGLARRRQRRQGQSET